MRSRRLTSFSLTTEEGGGGGGGGVERNRDHTTRNCEEDEERWKRTRSRIGIKKEGSEAMCT